MIDAIQWLTSLKCLCCDGLRLVTLTGYSLEGLRVVMVCVWLQPGGSACCDGLHVVTVWMVSVL